MTKPITPAEAQKKRFSNLPAFVIEAWNDMISQNMRGNRSDFLQDDIIERIISGAMSKITRSDVFHRGWLDVEPMYREAGWKVVYDKRTYNETHKSRFSFIIQGVE